MKVLKVCVHFTEGLDDYTLLVPWSAAFSIVEVLSDVLDKSEFVGFDVSVEEI